MLAESGQVQPATDLAQALTRGVQELPVEDFRIQDYRFERDARLGRELLFLQSNNEWAHRTTEIIDISRVRAVDVDVLIDIDLSQICHEAYQPINDQVYLPIFALPAERPVRVALELGGELDAGPVSASTQMDIRDASGARVAKVPQAELCHWLAAALAEILVRQLRRPPNANSQPKAATVFTAGDIRDQQVLLAAAIRRMLHGALIPSEQEQSVPMGRVDLTRMRRFDGRMPAARSALLRSFDQDKTQQHPVLASRVIQILDALLGTLLVVIPAARSAAPTSYIVRVPSRKLLRQSTIPRPSRWRLARWRLAPRARLRVDLQTASSHVDRNIRLVLPLGLTWAPGAGRATEVARIPVLAPMAVNQLRALMRQLVEVGGGRITWVDRQLAELALEKVDACAEAMRHYTVPQGTDADLTAQLTKLRGLLVRVAESGSVKGVAQRGEPRRELSAQWAGGTWLPKRLLRRLQVSLTSPDSIQVQAGAIEELSQRAQPTGATLDVQLAVTDSPVLDSARDTNVINILLLATVTVMLWLPRERTNSVHVEVIATVLTLFPAIAASRIERPDVTTLAGLLSRPSYWLSLASAVPATVLAATLGVASDSVAKTAALTALAVQLFVQLVILTRVSGTAAKHPRAAGGRFLLTTQAGPDHRRYDVIRSTWCRILTADALRLARPVHAKVLLDQDRPGAFTELLAATKANDPESNLLAVLAVAAAGHALTMVVGRDGHGRRSPATAGLVRSVPLDFAQLVPPDPPEWIVEVLVAIPVVQGLGTGSNRHPLWVITESAKVNNFRTLLSQYPCAPARSSSAHGQWMRIRIGVPYRGDDSLNGLRRFLTELRALRIAGYDINVHLVAELATLEASETAPEETSLGSHYSPKPLLLADRVEVAQEPDAAKRWRPMALCANGNVELLAQSLDSLAKRYPGMQIAAANSTVLHGMSVVFLLCRDPQASDPGLQLGRLVAEDLAVTDQLVAPVDGRVAIGASGSYPVGGGLASGPLLLIQLRATDRLGLVEDFFARLREALRGTLERRGQHLDQLDVWSALFRVVNGRTLQGRVTLRLPADIPAPVWLSINWPRLAARMYDSPVTDEATIVRIDLLRGQAELEPDPDGWSVPTGRTKTVQPTASIPQRSHRNSPDSITDPS